MKKLLLVKKKIGTLSKNSKNPFFKSQYLDLTAILEAVEPLLQDQGLVLLQPLKDGCVSTQIFDSESGELVCESSMFIPTQITDPQKLGSAITYFRRYTLKSLLAISEQDDDGNLASKPNAPVEPAKKWLNPGTKDWTNAVGKKVSLADVMKHYSISKDNQDKYSNEIK